MTDMRFDGRFLSDGKNEIHTRVFIDQSQDVLETTLAKDWNRTNDIKPNTLKRARYG